MILENVQGKNQRPCDWRKSKTSTIAEEFWSVEEDAGQGPVLRRPLSAEGKR